MDRAFSHKAEVNSRIGAYPFLSPMVCARRTAMAGVYGFSVKRSLLSRQKELSETPGGGQGLPIAGAVSVQWRPLLSNAYHDSIFSMGGRC